MQFQCLYSSTCSFLRTIKQLNSFPKCTCLPPENQPLGVNSEFTLHEFKVQCAKHISDHSSTLVRLSLCNLRSLYAYLKVFTISYSRLKLYSFKIYVYLKCYIWWKKCVYWSHLDTSNFWIRPIQKTEVSLWSAMKCSLLV